MLRGKRALILVDQSTGGTLVSLDPNRLFALLYLSGTNLVVMQCYFALKAEGKELWTHGDDVV